MQVLVASLMLLAAAAEAAVAQCPLSSPAAGLGAMTPACHLGQGQDQLTLVIRVSHADCNPASGTKVTVVASRDKSCRGVTSTDGYYVTSVQQPEVNKWSHVTIVGQGQGEKGALTVSMSRDVSSGNPQVQAVYADHTMSVVDTTCSGSISSSSSNCTAVISLVLETGVKAGSKGQGHGVEKRAWDDDSMNWLKRGGRWGEDMMWIKRADDDQAMTDDASNNKDEGARRRKRWDDDTMQWIKRGWADGDSRDMERKMRWSEDVDMAWLKRSGPPATDAADDADDANYGTNRLWAIEKRKLTQSINGLRGRHGGGRGRSRYHSL